MKTFSPQDTETLKAYFHCRNKIEAYKRAYETAGLAASVVRSRAYALFREEHMQFAVRQVEDAELERMKVDGSWVLRRAALLADFNINVFVEVDEHGTAYYDFSSATDDDWYCISEMTIDRIVKGMNNDKHAVDRVRLKPHDKIKALRLVAEHVDVQAVQQNIKHEVFDVAAYKKARLEMLVQDDC